MTRTVSRSAPLRQPIVVDRSRVDTALALLRQAMTESGWTFDALEAATGKDRSYLHRVLNGHARCTLEFLATLPLEIRQKYACLIAQQYSLVVLDPASAEFAAAHLAAILLGLIRPSAAKADLPMAKASIDSTVKVEVA